MRNDFFAFRVPHECDLLGSIILGTEMNTRLVKGGGDDDGKESLTVMDLLDHL
jgi:hypothetical protein